MVFATVCIGEDRRGDTMHLLNDLRNLGYEVFLYTNLDFDLEKFQFFNVKIIKTEEKVWNDFQRFIAIKAAFESTNEEFVYYLDADSRFIDCREEKFDKIKFESAISKINFDILFPWKLSAIRPQLEPPNLRDNPRTRVYKFGFDSVIEYFKSKNPNYEQDLNKQLPLETMVIFRRSDKIIPFIEELLACAKLVIEEEKKIGRTILVPGCGFAIGLLENPYKIKTEVSDIVYHFFKGNFLREVFPFNYPIDLDHKVLF